MGNLMKKLYLLRHAKAEPGSKDLGDKERPLAARGRLACTMMGNYIKEKSYVPDVAIASPSARTSETFERIVEAAGASVPVQFIDKLYLATADEMLHYIRLLSDKASSVLLVGHNPGMHHLALILSRPERTALRIKLELKYPTGSLAVLGFSGDYWKDVIPGEGTLTDFITPQTL